MSPCFYFIYFFGQSDLPIKEVIKTAVEKDKVNVYSGVPKNAYPNILPK